MPAAIPTKLLACPACEQVIGAEIGPGDSALLVICASCASVSEVNREGDLVLATNEIRQAMLADKHYGPVLSLVIQEIQRRFC